MRGAGHRWKYGACALHAGYLRLKIHTLMLCNTHCFSTATIFPRTRLNVTLYVHSLSCFVYKHLTYTDFSDLVPVWNSKISLEILVRGPDTLTTETKYIKSSIHCTRSATWLLNKHWHRTIMYATFSVVDGTTRRSKLFLVRKRRRLLGCMTAVVRALWAAGNRNMSAKNWNS